jgi:hypothetical protein
MRKAAPAIRWGALPGRPAGERIQLPLRRCRAALSRDDEKAYSARPTLVDMRTERDEIRKAKRRLGVARLDGLEQELRAVFGHLGRAIAKDEALAELCHRLDITAVCRDRELVDGLAMPAGRIVLCGNRYSATHHNLLRLARRELQLEA